MQLPPSGVQHGTLDLGHPMIGQFHIGYIPSKVIQAAGQPRSQPVGMPASKMDRRCAYPL
ncbi:MAG: hypothetical protein EA001_13680 [Oscillatoriales cyanobacterium]|nr:MAG: hypothetical protein EA001_13680 [Oscillatoriales cyanobacterium]